MTSQRTIQFTFFFLVKLLIFEVFAEEPISYVRNYTFKIIKVVMQEPNKYEHHCDGHIDGLRCDITVRVAQNDTVIAFQMLTHNRDTDHLLNREIELSVTVVQKNEPVILNVDFLDDSCYDSIKTSEFCDRDGWCPDWKCPFLSAICSSSIRVADKDIPQTPRQCKFYLKGRDFSYTYELKYNGILRPAGGAISDTGSPPSESTELAYLRSMYGISISILLIITCIIIIICLMPHGKSIYYNITSRIISFRRTDSESTKPFDSD